MLLNDARIIRSRLVRAEAASSSIEEANALASKKVELEQHVGRVVMLTRRNSLLRNEGIQLTPVQNAEKTRQLITQIGDRFRESPKSGTLVDKQRWTKLTAALTEFVASGETQQKADWKVYFSSKLFGGVPPEQRKQTILQTLPANKSALERYTFLYRCFNEHRNTVPSTAEALRELHTYSKDLADIEFVENDDVPPSVRAFFSATSTAIGASLDLLTPEVIEWLHTNKMLANYVVRAR
ncbi:protein DpdI [Paraburkholderia domus]|uniref:Uncharacterized protein n=1 Tax=Paraburkholderia domus TaxID=2793075 RepID=A0A9N8MK34_9BURK|nr:protein DpdI [Paraburkholderia domus]MBK5163798.1 hypothetical protein [Burkholderia sp. R-70211]CAE6858495.1 hypothetical protein R70211_00314 [Paraburkholderia domus]